MKKIKLTVISLISVLLLLGLTGVNVAEAKVSISDVSSKNAYYDDIQYVLENDIMNYTTSSKFSPNVYVKKQDATKFIAISSNLNTKTTVKAPKFSDVTSSNKDYAYISSLANIGAFTQSVKFNGEKQITRQELARLIVTAYDFKINKNLTFTDTKVNSYKDYVSTAVELGIMKPKTAKLFNPTGTLTRAELARIIHLAEKKDHELNSKATLTPNSNDYPIAKTALPYINVADNNISIKGDILQISTYMPVTIQREAVVEPVPGTTAAVINAMRAVNRAEGNTAQIIHDPELDKLAYQRVAQWGQIWDKYGETSGRASYKTHLSAYVPFASVQVVFYDNKYNDATEIATIASDWISLGASAEEFGKSIITNFNSSDEHVILYSKLNSENEASSEIAYGVGYQKNPSGSYNVVILRGAIYLGPSIDTMYRRSN